MRLVATGRELVALHEKRYGKHRYEPLQLARTKIENEAQAMGDRIAKDVGTIAPRRPRSRNEKCHSIIHDKQLYQLG